jgi:hypothetical protein
VRILGGEINYDDTIKNGSQVTVWIPDFENKTITELDVDKIKRSEKGSTQKDKNNVVSFIRPKENE